jgi:uncharacterized protein (DUF362 family)
VRPRVGARITRRELGALGAAGLASLALPQRRARATAQGAAVQDLAHAAGEPAPVGLAAVTRGAAEDAVERAVRAAAESVTDFAWLSRGDTVLLKLACNSGNPYPATTDPLALRAMIRLLRERGAGRVIAADMSGVQFVRFGPDQLDGSTRALLESSGLAAAAESAGAEVHAFEEAGWDGFFAEQPAAGEHWSGPLWLPNVLREVDHVVLMPRISTHVLARSTLALKLAVGWWRHDSRLEYHRDAASLPEKTAEASTAPALAAKQRLVLTSARQLFTTFGPDEGHVAEPEAGLVFASTEIVPHDMVSLAWLIETRRATPAEALGDDPGKGGFRPELINRVVTYWLGGLGAVLSGERLGRGEIDSVWSDRVLRRAFALGGGVPRLELLDADGSLPAGVRTRIAAELTLPA